MLSMLDANAWFGRDGSRPSGNTNPDGAPPPPPIVTTVLSVSRRRGDLLRANEELLDYCAATQAVRAVWTLVPPTPGEAPPVDRQLARARLHGAIAIRLAPGRLGVGSSALRDFAQTIRGADFPILMDLGESSWSVVRNIARAVPDLRVLVGGVGYRSLREIAPLFSEFPSLHLSMDGFTSHQGVEWFCEHFGVERILFATGRGTRDAGEAVARVLWSGLGDAEVEQVAYLNAQRFFRFNGSLSDCRAAGPGSSNDLSKSMLGRRPDSDLRIIDSHAHVGPFSAFFTPQTDPDSLISVMDRTGVAHAIISSCRAIEEDARRGNAEVRDAVRRAPDRFSGYLVVNPWQDPDGEVESSLDTSQFVGVKIHPSLAECPITDRRYSRVFELSEATRLPLLTHTWFDSPYDSLQLIESMAIRHPDAPLILGHSGVMPAGVSQAVELARRYSNVHLEICGSYFSAGLLEQMVADLGASRVLFGSDFPFIDQRVSLGRVAHSSLSPMDLEMVMRRNAEVLFSLRIGSPKP